MTPLPEHGPIDATGFAALREQGEPAVMRGLVADWPLVTAARDGRTLAYLRGFATPAPIDVIHGPPEIEGRFHYDEELTGFNFARTRVPLGALFARMEAEAANPHPPAYAAQSATIADTLPGLEHELPMPLLPGVPPKIWIGNAIHVATHHDPQENIACVAAGRRRFTLFPPEAVADLYIGPFEHTPAGAAISMVHLSAPDHARYPRFERALAVAQTAELAPGDAVYIPYSWWHAVHSLDPVSVLVNYWWNDARSDLPKPWDALLHAMLALKQLPPQQRRAWKATFDRYVFMTEGDPGDHLPEYARGILGEMTPQAAAHAIAMLKGVIERL